MRQLVVNADDFGFNRDVNRGIVRCHREGILTAATVMAAGDAFADAVSLAGENPRLEIGVHLQIVQGRSLSRPGQMLPETITQLIPSLLARRWDIRAEFRAQIEKILAAGLRPNHLDTHKHTHLLGPVLDAVADMSAEYGIRWVRKPFDLPLGTRYDTPKLRSLVWLMRRRAGAFEQALTRARARSTDHFTGFILTGRFEVQDLLDLLPQLPSGSTELICHPGELGPELASAPTRLKESRYKELLALIDPRVRQCLTDNNIQLCGYSDLANG